MTPRNGSRTFRRVIGSSVNDPIGWIGRIWRNDVGISCFLDDGIAGS